LGKAVFDNIPLNACLNPQILMVLLSQNSKENFMELEQLKEIDNEVY
jgi:hypothetical protein